MEDSNILECSEAWRVVLDIQTAPNSMISILSQIVQCKSYQYCSESQKKALVA
jgi:hypothetical protein